MPFIIGSGDKERMKVVLIACVVALVLLDALLRLWRNLFLARHPEKRQQTLHLYKCRSPHDEKHGLAWRRWALRDARYYLSAHNPGGGL